MIDRVRGTLVHVDIGYAVIEAGGVGIKISTSGATLRQLPSLGEQAQLLTYLVVREDALQLYGFASEAERELFLMLLGVQAVGPKLALAVLSSGDPSEIAGALAVGDVQRMQAVPGIGKRTAERIIVELREKVAPGLAAVSGGGVLAAHANAAVSDDPRVLARRGLEELGFGGDEAERLLLGATGDTVEQLLATALRGARA
jgi:Holliday junction DNA helicase RuvA